MNVLVILIPVALLMGGGGLAVFFWALRDGQFDDLEGAAQRILIDDEEDQTVRPEHASPTEKEDEKGAE